MVPDAVVVVPAAVVQQHVFAEVAGFDVPAVDLVPVECIANGRWVRNFNIIIDAVHAFGAKRVAMQMVVFPFNIRMASSQATPTCARQQNEME